MKLGIKILITTIIVLTLLFSAAYIFIALKGKVLIIKRLEDLTHKKVSVGYFDLTPPLNLTLKNLNIEGLTKVESVFISPSIPYLITGNIALNKVMIVRPDITFERNPPILTELPATTEGSKVTPTTAAQPKKKRFPRLILKRLNIKEGKINFIDHTVGTQGIKIVVKDINFNLTNLNASPLSVITNFELKGRLPWQQGKEEGKIGAEGWLNFSKKDMQATLKIEDIDGIYLYPYYSQWVDLEKARIESAKLNFISNINGLNNNVTAECHLELTDIVRKPRSPEEPEEKAEKIASAVLDIFKALNQGKIVLDFTIRTKMDRPEFGFGNIKMAFEDKLAKAQAGSGFKAEDVLMLPGKLLEGMVKGATDFSKAVIDGTFAVGNEVKKAVEDTFKKEPKESEKDNK